MKISYISQMELLLLKLTRQIIKRCFGGLLYVLVNIECDDSPFAVFYRVASTYLDSIEANPTEKATDIMTLWSAVHGISVLFAENSISFDGDYLDIVSDMLYKKLKFKI